MNSETNHAYLAGILDGEGTFSIQINNWGNFAAKISVPNNAFELHVWLNEYFGGSTKPSHKGRCFTTTWSSKETMLAVINAVIPYLVIKKREAEIVKLLLERGVGEFRHLLSDEERLALLEELQAEHQSRRSKKEVTVDGGN